MTSFNGFNDLGEELQQFADELEEFADRLPAALDTGVEATARDVSTAASIKAPKDSNRLANSIKAERERLMHWVVGTNVPYAEDVEKGTSPHVITPDDADALHFTVNGQEVFAARVEHPGTPAQPYLGPALHEHESALVESIEDAIADLLREVFS